MRRRRDRKTIHEPRRTSADIVPLPWVAQRKRPASKRQAAPTDPDDYPISDRTLLTVVVFLAFLIVSSVWLLETMRKNAILEECLMAGRKNCAPSIATPIVER